VALAIAGLLVGGGITLFPDSSFAQAPSETPTEQSQSSKGNGNNWTDCFADFGSCLGNGLANGATKLVAAFFLLGIQVFGALLGWASAFFNQAAQITVFQFAVFFGNTEGLLLSWR